MDHWSWIEVPLEIEFPSSHNHLDPQGSRWLPQRTQGLEMRSRRDGKICLERCTPKRRKTAQKWKQNSECSAISWHSLNEDPGKAMQETEKEEKKNSKTHAQTPSKTTNRKPIETHVRNEVLRERNQNQQRNRARNNPTQPFKMQTKICKHITPKGNKNE